MTPAEALLTRARTQGATVALAESCTGGMIAAAITDLTGASAVLTHGVVAYANEAKRDLLGVPMALIEQYGAVSRPVAEAMAAGALRLSGAAAALSVTGIAGPGGGSEEKPVGLVWFGVATRQGGARQERRVFGGDRASVRRAATEEGLRLLADALPGEASATR